MNDILHFRSDENEVLLKDGLTFEVTDAQWETSDESRFESQFLILTVRVVPSRKP